MPGDEDTLDQITALLEDWRKGDASAFDAASRVLYAELHRTAQAYVRRFPNENVQPTLLINEAYMRMAGKVQKPFKDRRHFLALAARVMRQVLVDGARERRAQKRGEGVEHVQLDEQLDGAAGRFDEFLIVDNALSKLAEENAELAKVVELRYFGGLELNEVAEVLEMSVATVTRKLRLAEAWLHRALSGGHEQSRPGTA